MSGRTRSELSRSMSRSNGSHRSSGASMEQVDADHGVVGEPTEEFGFQRPPAERPADEDDVAISGRIDPTLPTPSLKRLLKKWPDCGIKREEWRSGPR